MTIIFEQQMTYNFLKIGAKWASNFYKIFLIIKEGAN